MNAHSRFSSRWVITLCLVVLLGCALLFLRRTRIDFDIDASGYPRFLGFSLTNPRTRDTVFKTLNVLGVKAGLGSGPPAPLTNTTQIGNLSATLAAMTQSGLLRANTNKVQPPNPFE